MNTFQLREYFLIANNHESIKHPSEAGRFNYRNKNGHLVDFGASDGSPATHYDGKLFQVSFSFIPYTVNRI